MTNGPSTFNPHFAYAPSGIVETTADWLFVRCNQSARTILHQLASLQSKPMDQWFDAEHATETVEHFSLLKLQGLYHSELSISGAGRSPRRLDVSSVQADNNLYIHFINDITHAWEQGRALQLALEQSEQAQEAKSAFLATVSHEIRTPLNGVLGLAQLSLRTELPVQVRQNLEKIARSGQVLLALVNDVLDFSKMSAGQLQFEQQPFDLWDVLEDLANICAHSQPDKRLALAFVLDPALPRHLVGDRQRLTQVLTNLLGNALKFTEQGHVTLTLRADETLPEPKLFATVCDTGPGMSADTLSKLFQPFEQGNESLVRRRQGTGLGLVLARSMAQGMGGELSVTSQLGAGSQFTLELPLKPVEEPQPPHTASISAPTALKVGVKAPQTWMQQALEQMVQVCGHRVANESPDVWLVDSPTTDSLSGNWLIGATDSDGVMQTPALFTVAAADTHVRPANWPPDAPWQLLARPITPLSLQKALILATEGNNSNATDWEVPTEFAGRQIAVAEDVPVNQDVIVGLLQHAGIRTQVFDDGAALVAWLKLHPEAVDMVLMDVHMPVLDGLGATKALRAQGYNHPIVALSAGLGRDELTKCEQAGMNDFLSKPIDADELWGTLTRWLPAQHLRSPTENLTPPARPPAPAPSLDWMMVAQAAGVDLASALPRFLDQPEALRKALQRFLTQHQDDVQAMQSMLDVADGLQLRQRAHALRGGAATVGALALQKAAESFEKLPLDAAPAQRQSVLKCIDDAVNALQPLHTLLSADSQPPRG